MKYERLTRKSDDGYELKRELIKSNSYNEFLVDSLQLAVNRLAELEDKIENGTLVIANRPFVVLDYISNGNQYYAVRIAEEKDLFINLTKAEAEQKLKELEK